MAKTYEYATETVKDKGKLGRPKAATRGDKGLDILINLEDNPTQCPRQFNLNYWMISQFQDYQDENIRP